MFDAIVINWQDVLYVLLAWAVFAALYFADMCDGIKINCYDKGQPFDGKRFFSTVIDLALFAVYGALIAIGLGLLAAVVGYFGAEIPANVTGLVSVALFALLFVKGAYQRALNLYNKIKDRGEIKDNTDTAAIEEYLAGIGVDGRGHDE